MERGGGGVDGAFERFGFGDYGGGFAGLWAGADRRRPDDAWEGNCAAGVGFGGNKLRKLDYVLHEAMAGKADTLVSGGVVQSNSQVQVAAAAAKLGLRCHLAVYHGRLSPPTPEYETSGNAFLNRLFGAHLHDVPWTGDRNGAIQALGERLRQEGRRPYFIPYGVSNALGAVGYASTIDEIAAQSSACGFHPSAIVHSTGSAATQAGLVVGASIALKGTRVVGIDIDAEPERVRSDVVRYANVAANLLEASSSGHQGVDGPGQQGATAGRPAHDHWMNSPSSGRIHPTIHL